MAAPAPRTRTGCSGCRVRHLKCDETRPVCKRCARAGRECIRGYNVRFRYSNDLVEIVGKAGKGGEYRFEEDQEWVEVPKEVEFLDETTEITKNYETISLSPSQSPIPASSHSPQTTSPSTSAIAIHNLISSPSSFGHRDSIVSLASTHRTSFSERRHVLSPSAAPTPGPFDDSNIFHNGSHTDNRESIPLQDILVNPSRCLPPPESMLPPATHLSSQAVSCMNCNSTGEALNSPDLYREVMWPIADLEVAKLFRHYVNNIGEWFDMHDALSSFRTSVPTLCATCPMLTNAVLAFSARHLSHTSGYDKYAADRYHAECLKSYIPALSSTSHQLDAPILAATVILRTFEELQTAQLGCDEEHYLAGSSTIFGTLHPRIAISGGLRQACFYTYVRQDIYASFVNQRPVKTNLRNLQLDRSFSDADDCTWANRIVLLCAELLCFAFGPPSASPEHAWQQLRDSVDTWELKRSSGFTPIFYQDRDLSQSRYFPEIWYTQNCNCTGIQYLYLCRILLAIYNPTIPKLGPGMKTAREQMQQEVMHQVRNIVGVAVSNRPAPAWFTAAHVIYVCGEWFEDEGEQRALLGVLETTESKFAWPTKLLRTALEKQWRIGFSTE